MFYLVAAYLAFPTGNSTVNPEFYQTSATKLERSSRFTYYPYPINGPFIRLDWVDNLDIPERHFIPPGIGYWQRRRPNFGFTSYHQMLHSTILSQGTA